MQTFMPFNSFTWSVRCLDNRRLGKQRVETLQIMQVLLKGGGAWSSHPAVRMWRGRERALLAYQQATCHEWVVGRGFKDTCWDKTRLLFLDSIPNAMSVPLVQPWWMGDVDFHISHQSNLLRKNEAHYRPFFPGIRADHPYIWPV